MLFEDIFSACDYEIQPLKQNQIKILTDLSALSYIQLTHLLAIRPTAVRSI